MQNAKSDEDSEIYILKPTDKNDTFHEIQTTSDG